MADADAASEQAAESARRARFADQQCDYLRGVLERRDLELDRVRRACLAETVARERLHRRLGEERAASALEGALSATRIRNGTKSPSRPLLSRQAWPPTWRVRSRPQRKR